jgi:glutathione S-transferase
MAAPSPAPCPVLYSFRRCPYAMRARLALAASGTVCELREVVLAHKPAALLRASPKGTVPVLILLDGTVLEQSLDIMLWALRRHDPYQWLPADAQELADVLQLISLCDGDFKTNLDRYKYPNRYGMPDGVTHRAQGALFLHSLNERLTRSGYLSGDHFALADAATAPFVRQFAHTDRAWFASQPWPALQQWLSNFETSGDFTSVMHKYAAWTEAEIPQVFPTSHKL